MNSAEVRVSTFVVDATMVDDDAERLADEDAEELGVEQGDFSVAVFMCCSTTTSGAVVAVKVGRSSGNAGIMRSRHVVERQVDRTVDSCQRSPWTQVDDVLLSSDEQYAQRDVLG